MTGALSVFLVSLTFGLFISLFIGHKIIELVVNKLHELGKVHVWQNPDGTEHEQRIRSDGEHQFTVTLGVIERIAIMVIAMFSLQGAGVFTLAWMGLKLASHWNRPGRIPTPSGDQKEPPCERKAREENLRREARGALASLVGSLISAGFAILGAYIACGKWWASLMGLHETFSFCPGFC